MDFIDRYKILMEGAHFDGVDCLTAGEHLGGGNACEVENGLFYYGLARRYKPHMVAQTGTHWGFDTSWIAMGLEENGADNPLQKGLIMTFDLDDYEKRAEKLWERLELTNIRQHIGDSRVPETLHISGVPEAIEWLHLDADHSAESVIQEFNLFAPYLSNGHCIVSSHDTRLDKRLSKGINWIVEYLESLRQRGKGWRMISYVPVRNLRGLDLIFLSNETY